MTIKELYEQAKARGMENSPLMLDFSCSDDYYSGKFKINAINWGNRNDNTVYLYCEDWSIDS